MTSFAAKFNPGSTGPHANLGDCSGNVTLDLRNNPACTFSIKVVGDMSVNIINAHPGICKVVLFVEHGGRYVITWPDNIRWNDNAPPELTSHDDDIVYLTVRDGNTRLLATHDLQYAQTRHFDLLNYTTHNYLNQFSKRVHTVNSSERPFRWKHDGLAYFIFNNGYIHEYSTPIPFEHRLLTPTGRVSPSLYTLIPDGNSSPKDFHFSADGDRLYVSWWRRDYVDQVVQLNLSDWNVETLVSSGKTINLRHDLDGVKSVCLNPACTKLIVLMQSRLMEYTLSTPKELNTASYTNYIYVSANWVTFSEDGSKLFYINSQAYQINLVSNYTFTGMYQVNTDNTQPASKSAPITNHRISNHSPGSIQAIGGCLFAGTYNSGWHHTTKFKFRTDQLDSIALLGGPVMDFRYHGDTYSVQPPYRAGCYAAWFDRDGEKALFSPGDGFIREWAAPTPNAFDHAVPTGVTIDHSAVHSSVRGLDVSRDKSKLFMLGDDGKVSVWNVGTPGNYGTAVYSGVTFDFKALNSELNQPEELSVSDDNRTFILARGSSLYSFNCPNLTDASAATNIGKKDLLELAGISNIYAIHFFKEGLKLLVVGLVGSAVKVFSFSFISAYRTSTLNTDPVKLSINNSTSYSAMGASADAKEIFIVNSSGIGTHYTKN